MPFAQIEVRRRVSDEAEVAIIEAVHRPAPLETDATPYGDGNAAARVVDEILAHSR